MVLISFKKETNGVRRDRTLDTKGLKMNVMVSVNRVVYLMVGNGNMTTISKWQAEMKEEAMNSNLDS